MRIALFIFALTLLLSSAAAGTVTLTGSCVNHVLNGNTVQFNISNSGNDTAYSMLIAPTIAGARPSSNIYNISSLGPGEQVAINFTLENVTEKGAYAGYFVATYGQGASSMFTAVFPCVLYFYNTTVSQILLSTNESLLPNGTVSVRVTAVNAGNDAISANVSIIVPPTLSEVSSRFFSIDLAPHASEAVTFRIMPLSSDQAAYGAAATASYSKNGLGYVTLAKFVVSFGKQASESIGSILVIATAAIILALLALLIFVLLKKNRKKAQE